MTFWIAMCWMVTISLLGCQGVPGCDPIPGYQAFPGGQQFCCDMTSTSGDLTLAALMCSADPQCRGFDSSGTLKSSVFPFSSTFGDGCLYTKAVSWCSLRQQGYCLELSDGYIYLENCTAGRPQQRWGFFPTGPSVHNFYSAAYVCLTADGNLMAICDSSDAQQQIYINGTSITTVSGTYCLAAVDGGIVFQTCDILSPFQVWDTSCSECVDTPSQWVDLYSTSCSAYAAKSFCTDTGSADPTYASSLEAAVSSGPSAGYVCCYCGGGTVGPSSSTGGCGSNQLYYEYDKEAFVFGNTMNVTPSTVVADNSISYPGKYTWNGCALDHAGPQDWYKLKITKPARITASTCGWDTFDTVLAVYWGNCSSLRCIADNDDDCTPLSTVTVDVPAGTYHIVVGGTLSPDGIGWNSGMYKLTYTIENAENNNFDRRLKQLIQNRTAGTAHSDTIYDVCISTDGVTALTASATGQVGIWRVSDGALLRMVQVSGVPINATGVPYRVAVTSSRDFFVVGFTNGTVALWRVGDGQYVLTMDNSYAFDVVTALAISPDNTQVAACIENNAIFVYSMAKGSLLSQTNLTTFNADHTPIIRNTAMSPDGTQLAFGSTDTSVYLLDLKKGTVTQWRAHDQDVTGVVFTHDGSRVISSSYDGSLIFWKASCGTNISRWYYGNSLTSVAISSDDQVVVTGSYNGTIQLWNLSTGDVTNFLKHKNDVTKVATATVGTTSRSVLLSISDKYAWTWKGPTVAVNPDIANFASCVDQANWMDVNNFTCSTYTAQGWCASYTYGPSWVRTWGTFSKYVALNSPLPLAADQACCACGYARNPSIAVQCVLGDWSHWGACLGISEGQGAQSRTRPVKTLPANGGASCGPTQESTSCFPFEECKVGPWTQLRCVYQNLVLRTRTVQTSFIAGVRCPDLSLLTTDMKNCTNRTSPPSGENLQMFGNNNDGQLGVKGTTTLTVPSSPLVLPNKLEVTNMVLGGYHTAVFAGTLMFVLGNNDYGQLGLGDEINRNSPTLLPSPDLVETIAQAALGEYSTSIILTNKNLLMFGSNTNGQLCLGDTINRYVPTAISKWNGRVLSVAMGSTHSAFIVSPARLFLCGDNTYGQLGSDYSTVPWSYAPSELQGYSVSSVSLGYYHTMFLSTQQDVLAFGSNYDGQLCLIPADEFYVPVMIFSRIVQVTSVQLGKQHSGFLLANGTLIMCGLNDKGQLGLGHTNLVLGPQLVVAVGVTGLNLGMHHTGVIIGGRAVTFGLNANGQLGIGSTADSNAVLQDVAASGYHGPVIFVYLGATHSAILKQGTKTPTPTGTPMMTYSSSTTQTITMSSTATAFWDLCGNVSEIDDSGSSLILPKRCVQDFPVKEASTTWRDRKVTISVVNLFAAFSVVVRGCVDGNCTLNFSSDGSADSQTVKLAKDTVHLSLIYGHEPRSTSANRRSATTDLPIVQISTSYSGSAALLAITCVAAALMAALIALALLLAYKARYKRQAHTPWDRNPRLAKGWVQSLLFLGLCLLLTGVGWCIIVAVTSKPDIQPIGLLGAGAALIAIGAILLLVFGFYALRDPAPFNCLACGKHVRRWRFCGFYIPSDEDEQCAAKAHKNCIKCVSCGRPAVTRCWKEAPRNRRYHAECWDAHCTAAVADENYINQWWANNKNAATDTELVHMLAAATQHSAVGSIQALMHLRPTLNTMGVAQEENRTCMHLAARSGNLPVLQLLLESAPYCLDPVCPVYNEDMNSVSIKGLEEENDIYIQQPFATYNDRPVYIGHTKGKYIFWYTPDPGDAKDKSAEGWCLAGLLGSGSQPLRLPLPDIIVSKKTVVGPVTVSNTERENRLRYAVTRIRRKLPFVRASGRREQPQVQDDKQLSFGENPIEPPQTPMSGAMSPPKDPLVPREGEAEDETPPFVLPPEFHMEMIPHTQSLLEEAIISDDIPTIKQVAELYEAQDPGCIIWKVDEGHRLLHRYPPDIQSKIRKAMSEGQRSLALGPENSPPTLDFSKMQAITHDKPPQTLHKFMRTIFQTRETSTGQFLVTSDAENVLNWKDTFVVFSPGAATAAAADETVLKVLSEAGIVDFSLWKPPFKVGTRTLEPQATWFHESFNHILGEEVSLAMQVSNSVAMHRKQAHSPDGEKQGRGQVGAGSTTGIGSRLTDGLDSTQSDDCHEFYWNGYWSDTGTLPFCAALPADGEKVGLRFMMEPIVDMCHEALMKLYEMQRQLFDHHPAHIIAIYAYSYELTYDTEGYDQIYGAMNRAMRLRLQPLIEFFRPLIWEIDMALRALPVYHGKCYRGINVQLSPDDYQTGRYISWPSFSSASSERSVAEEFAKGDAGTLFFLQSNSAHPISAISRFPEEAEVLFPPNSVFQVTSFLLGTSEIGSFYGKVDNVAMSQCAGEVMPVLPTMARIAGHSSFLIHVPTEASNQILLMLARAGLTVLENVEREGDNQIRAELLAAPNLSYIRTDSQLTDDFM